MPRTPFIRYRGLCEWLRGQGLSGEEVRKLIADGVIPRRRFGRGTRHYYPVSAVAAALDIPDPLAAR